MLPTSSDWSTVLALGGVDGGVGFATCAATLDPTRNPSKKHPWKASCGGVDAFLRHPPSLRDQPLLRLEEPLIDPSDEAELVVVGHLLDLVLQLRDLELELLLHRGPPGSSAAQQNLLSTLSRKSRGYGSMDLGILLDLFDRINSDQVTCHMPRRTGLKYSPSDYPGWKATAAGIRQPQGVGR